MGLVSFKEETGELALSLSAVRHSKKAVIYKPR